MTAFFFLFFCPNFCYSFSLCTFFGVGIMTVDLCELKEVYRSSLLICIVVTSGGGVLYYKLNLQTITKMYCDVITMQKLQTCKAYIIK